MFLDHASPDTGLRLEEREKCEVLYPGSGLLHDHVGQFVLVLKKSKNQKSCTLIPVFSMIMSGGLFSSLRKRKCEVLYPGSGLLHDHVGRFVLVFKKGKM
jgi:hypothetical protein